VLKGGFVDVKGSAGFLRKALVAFQFTISICLIIATIVIIQQMEYILNKDPGFDKEQVIVLTNADGLPNREVLKVQIAQLPDVTGVGASTTIIGKPTWTTNIKADPAQNFQLIDFLQIDYGYFDALGIQLLKGRKFSPLFPADTINTIILNETAVRALNLKEPIGQRLIWDEGGPDTTLYASVVGVVRDFHYASFHEPIRPFAFLVRNNFFVHGDFTSKLFIKTDSRYTGNTLRQLEKLWKEHVPQRPFSYVFLDDSFNTLHATEERFKTLFTWLTALAIFIACLGLSGLTAFVVTQRKKEIGIRKVLGASVTNIVVLINKDFMKMILAALIIAAPIAFYFMEKWLEDFAYRVELKWWIIAVAGAVVTLIMIITTGYQSVKASLNNPVESLKVE
jgi:putative ABC transport system permease protein